MSLRQAVLSKGLPPAGGGKKLPPGKDLSPLVWSEFFDSKETKRIGQDSFTVYTKGNSGPIFYLLHGGGYSGLTWACFVEELCRRIDCRILCPDLRGHGSTVCEEDYELSKERQVQDIAAIFNAVYPENRGARSDEKPPDVCIVGHSMGGALAVHTAAANLIPNVVGLIVIDVVEGSAMDALSGMITFLRGRPQSFESEEAAIKWCIQSGMSKTSKSARISMPSQVTKANNGKYIWRIDLTKTADHWPGWFQGLSTTFLSCPPPKLLVLAGVDRLDKDLTIAQMQGKFQTTVLPRVGHAVHEDSPSQLADEVARFAARYKFAKLNPEADIGMRPALRLGQII